MGQERRHQVTAAGLALAVGVGMLVGAAVVWSASDGEESSRSSRAPRAAASNERESALKTSAIEAKLDEILSGQEAILGKFDAVMEELRIIKIRSTLRGGS